MCASPAVAQNAVNNMIHSNRGNSYNNFGEAGEGRLWKYYFGYTMTNRNTNEIYLGEVHATSKKKAIEYVEKEDGVKVGVMRSSKYNSKTV